MLPSLRRPLKKSLLIAASLVSLSSMAIAAPVTWDPSATAGVQGGTGTWNTTTANWTTNAGASNIVWTGAADTAVFSATAGTVTLGSSIALSGINISTAGYTIAGATGFALNFGATNGVIDTTALGTGASAATISAALSGSAGLTFNSHGNMSYNGGGSSGFTAVTSDFTGLTGGITVTSGWVNLYNATGLGSNVITLNGGGLIANTSGALSNNVVLGASGGFLRQYGAATVSMSGAISGTGSLTKTDGGIINLTGTNSYTGGTIVGNGTINLSGDNSAANGGWNIGPSVGSTNYTATVNFLAGSVVNVAAGKIVQIGANNGSGGISAAILNASGTVNNAGDLFVGRIATLNLNNGAVWNQAGTFNVATQGGYQATLNVNSGATLNYTGTSAINVSGGSSGNVVFNLNGTLTTGQAISLVTGTSTGVAQLTLNGGVIRLTSNIATLVTTTTASGGTGTNTFTIGASGATIDTNGFSTSIGMIIGGGATSLTKNGAGNLTLSSAVATSLTQFVTVNGGTLTLTGGGFGVDRMSGAGVLAMNTGSTLVIGNAHALGGSNGGMTETVVLNGATMTQNAEQYFNAITLNGATVNGVGEFRVANASNIQVGGGSASTISNGVGLYNSANINVASGSSLTITGTINTPATFTGGIVKTGAGRLTLSGSNTYTGGTTVNGGTLALDYSTNNTSKLADAGVLTLGGGRILLSGATGSHVEAVGSTTLTGGAAIDRDGANTAKIALGAITRASGGSLNVNAAGLATTTTANVNGILAGVTFGGSQLAMNDGSGNIVAYTGAYVDVTRLSSGSKTIANGVGTNVRIIEGSGAASDLTVGSGTTTIGTLTQAATGGPTNIALGGILRLAAAGTIVAGNGTGALSFTGGTLTAGGADNTAGDLLITATGTASVAIGSVVANNGTAAVTLSKSGTGTVILTGNNTYTNTVVGNGTLQVGNGGTSGTLGSGTITINGGTLAFNRSDAVTISSVISGGGSFVQNGSGTLTLNAGNTFAGSLTVNSGTLATGTTQGTSYLGQVSGSRTITVNSGATLAMNTNNIFGGGGTALSSIPNLVIVGGTVSDTNYNVLGNVTLSNGATMASTLAATGGYTAYEFKGGATVTVTNTSGTAASTITAPGINLAGSVTFNVDDVTASTAGDLAIASVVANASADNGSVAGNLVKTGSGTLVLTGASTYTGTTTISAGTLQIGDTTASGSLASATIVNNATLAFARTDAVTFSGVISGTGSVVQRGTGNLTLSSATNSFTGNVLVSSGTLTASVANAANTTSVLGALSSTRSVVVNSGATLAFTLKDILGTSTQIVAAIPVIDLEGGTFTTSTANVVGSVTLNSGATMTSTVAAGTSGFEMFGGTVTVGGTAASTIGGTGLVTLGGGTSTTFNVSDVTADAGSDLVVNAVLANGSTDRPGAGGITKTGGGTMALTAANTYTGVTTITAGTLQIGNGGTTGALGTGGIVDNGILAFNRTNAFTVANAISGSGAVTQVGSGVTTLSGTNTYTGLTTVAAGTLRLGAAGAFNGAGALTVASGAVFDANNNSFTTASLTGAGSVTLGTASITVVQATGSAEFSGVVSGSGALTHSGAGTVVLSGTNTYTGDTNVTGGTLQLGSGGASGSIASVNVNVAAGTNLAFNRSDASLFGVNILGDGGVTQNGAIGSVVTLTGANTYTGLTTVTSGTLRIGAATAFAGHDIFIDTNGVFAVGDTNLQLDLSTTSLTGTGQLRVDNGNLTINAATNSRFDGSITGTGTFTKAGAGAFTITGSGSFGGNVSITGGELVFGGASGSITAGGGTITVVNPASLVFDHTDATTFAANIVGEVGATFVSRGAGATTVTGTVGGDIGVVTQAGSTLVLANTANTVGAVTNDGTTTIAGDTRGTVAVNAGVLTIGTGIADTASKLSGVSTTVASGARLVFASGNQYSVTGLAGDGIVEQQGAVASVVTLTGDNSGLTANSTLRFSSGTVAITDATNVGSALLEFNAGKLVVGVVGGSGPITLNNDIETALTTDGVATLSYLTGNQDLVLNGNISGDGFIRYSGAGSLSGANLPASQIVEDRGTIDLSGRPLATTNYNDNLNFTNSGALADLVILQNEAGTASGTIAGAINLVKNGTGQLTLTGANTYTGTTTVNAGTLAVGDGGTSGSLGSGAVTLTGGTLAFKRSDAIAVSNNIVGSGAISNTGTGAVTLSGEVNVGTLATTGNGAIILTHTATLTDGVAGAPNQTPSAVPLSAYADTLSGSGPVQLGSGVNFGVSGGTYTGALTGAGSLTKIGSGTFVVAGDGNITGGVSVLQGTLQFGANGTTGTLGTNDVFVAATGTVAFAHSDTYVFSSMVTGPGQLTQSGSGTLVLTGNSNYTGKTTIAAGSTLRIGDGGTGGGIGGGLVQNSGMLEFAHSDNLPFSNTIVGTGGVRQTTASTLRLTGNNTYSGLTEVINGGNIILNTASLPAGAFNVGANSTLTFTGSGAGTIRGQLTGDTTGTVALTGSGSVVTLTTAPYAGRITVGNGATLKLGTSDSSTATLGAGALLVQLGGKLTGSGYIAGSLTNNGSISPGYSPGVITVGGNFTTTGTLNMEIAGNGAAGATNGYDQIRFGGVANIAGTLNITFTNGFTPGSGFAATLLQDTNPVAGEQSINGDFIYVNINGGTGRLIRGTDALVFFSGTSIAQIPNLPLHDGVAAFANALSPSATIIHPEFANFIALYSNQGVGALATALQNASPVGLAALTAMPTTEANKQADELRRRAEAQTTASGTPFGDEADWLAYAGGTGAMLDTDSGSSSPSFDSRIFGGYVGLERRMGDGGAAIGVRISYDNGTADLHSGGGKAEQDHGAAALYALTQIGDNGYVVGSVGMGYSSFDTKRNTLGGVEKASPTGWDLSASLDAGYILRLDKQWMLTPHAGFSLVSANVGGFTEKGSDLALAVDGYSQTSLTTRIGTGLVREWASKNFRRDAIRVGVDFSYEHVLFGDEASIPAAFASFPQAGGFTSDAPSLIKDSVVVGPQVQWVLNDTQTISIGYRFQYGFDGSTGHRGDISFEQRF